MIMTNAFMVPMSPMPVDIEYPWQETQLRCPQCGDVRLWEAEWRESTDDEGGEAHGIIRECGKCHLQIYL
jgi:hypothetical protein